MIQNSWFARGVTLFVSALLVATFVVLFLYGLSVLVQPFEYTEQEFVPLHAELCPGEPLMFHYSARVRRTPFMVMLVETIWRVAPGAPTAVIFDEAPAWIVVNHSGVVEAERTYPLPNLSPGEYEYVRGAFNGRSLSDHLVVKFKVKEC